MQQESMTVDFIMSELMTRTLESLSMQKEFLFLQNNI